MSRSSNKIQVSVTLDRDEYSPAGNQRSVPTTSMRTVPKAAQIDVDPRICKNYMLTEVLGNFRESHMHHKYAVSIPLAFIKGDASAKFVYHQFRDFNCVS